MIIIKITSIKTWLVSPTGVYLKIMTDEGISGYGEATIPYFPQSALGMLRDLEVYLIGENPMRIEYLWQSMFRDLFMRAGPAHMAAISCVDMALYDIKGKVLGVPVYELLGGKVRDRVRLYGHVADKSAPGIAQKAKKLADSGVNMIRFRAFHDSDDRREFDYATGVNQQLEYLDAIRKAVGDEVDLIVECHGRYDLPWAVKLGRAMEPYNVFFMEDPLRQENPAMMKALREQVNVPIATGERCHSRWDFRELFESYAINYARPDVCHCGGITEMMKIASYAQTYGVSVVPHNTQGPLAMAAIMHASFAIDNIAVVEAVYCNPDNFCEKRNRIAQSWPVYENGYSPPPKGPGLGIIIDEELLDASEADFKPPIQPRLRAFDGSVRDW